MTTTETIGRSIRQLMAYQGKKNNDLARELGCTPAKASAIRNGRQAISVDDLFIAAKWLGVTTKQLAQGYELVPVMEAA